MKYLYFAGLAALFSVQPCRAIESRQPVRPANPATNLPRLPEAPISNIAAPMAPLPPEKLFSSDSYGSRSQLAALNRGMEQVLGQPAKPYAPLWVRTNPLLNRAWSFLKPGAPVAELRQRLDTFIENRQRQWNEPVTELRPGSMPGFDAFRAKKAIALTRFNRRPSEVTEGFTLARGLVYGQKIAARRLFWQRWQSVGSPSGKLVILSPGFQETGRTFEYQIDALNRAGHEVIAMDHQWSGYSEGSSGGVDRGFGLARDVAAMVAWAANAFPGRELILMGHSMGAGPGALAAITLNDAGKIALEGPAMPAGLSAVLQAPYLDWTPNLINRFLSVLSHIPIIRRLPVFSLPVPVLTDIEAVKLKLSELAVIEDIRAQPRALTAPLPDNKALLALLESGGVPKGKVYLIQSAKDPLAWYPASARALAALAGRSRTRIIAAKTHVLDDSPAYAKLLLEAIDWVSNSRPN